MYRDLSEFMKYDYMYSVATNIYLYIAKATYRHTIEMCANTGTQVKLPLDICASSVNCLNQAYNTTMQVTSLVLVLLV